MNDLAVLMSVYRNDKLEFVTESVSSILNQTYTGFVFYIMFDGPVGPEIEKYIESIEDNRIKIFKLQINKGLAEALNCLLKIALANPEIHLIARMDADDISSIKRLEMQRDFLLDNPCISCVGSWYEEIDESGRHLKFRNLPSDHESLRRRFYLRAPFAHPSVMYRRQLIEKSGFYPTDTIFMEDNVLWGNALKEGFRFANITEYLLKFRIDNDFYKRRSGVKYGWSYIKTKFMINNNLRLPVYYNILSVGMGGIKMLPSFIIRYFYCI